MQKQHDSISSFQRAFIELAIERQVLQFGDFTLKSGRKSPYFYNSGLFNTGQALAQLGQAYAAKIQALSLEYDTLFAPAYKGIPILCATAVALAQQYQKDVPWCFNRKEAKAYGEGGQLIGAPLAGKVLIVDDVITAGTAIRESIVLIEGAGAQVAGVVIALDRQEPGQQSASALSEMSEALAAPVASIVTLDDIIAYLDQEQKLPAAKEKLEQHRQQFVAC